MQAEISHIEFRAALKAVGKSQKDIAEMSGRSVGMVSKWATGTHAIPKYVASMLILLNPDDARHDPEDFSGNAFQTSFLFEWYETLGISHKATPAEIRKARNELARKYHPDMARASDKKERSFASSSIMARVSAAYADAKKALGTFSDNSPEVEETTGITINLNTKAA